MFNLVQVRLEVRCYFLPLPLPLALTHKERDQKSRSRMVSTNTRRCRDQKSWQTNQVATSKTVNFIAGAQHAAHTHTAHNSDYPAKTAE